VTLADRAAGREATEAMIQAGHRRILYADWWVEHHQAVHQSRKDRLAGYREAMNVAGLPTLEALPERIGSFDAHAERALQVYTPTAAVAYGPEEVNALVVGAFRSGRNPPTDLSLATFHPQPWTCGFDIATWLVPKRELGRAAARLLIARAANRGVAEPPKPIPFVCHPGSSILPPSGRPYL
jgi:DNA-binding LacI/PurR family transcriptional regulator